MKELTKAEEQVMQFLWRINKGFVKDIIDLMPEPKPAYNTVSTIIRILESKGFVDHRSFGKNHEYFPLIQKGEYSNFYFNNFLTGYFGGSFDRLVSFFAKENDLDIKDVDQLMQNVKDNLNNEDDEQNN
jgi:BlaI family penicillinase repressor